MYAFAPRARPRSRSSSAPSVVMMMMGMLLSCAFCRTSETSLRPSITGMLMSVRIRSIFSGPESFFSASTPSTASMILAFLNRFRENEINCRMVGESSTTRKFAFSSATIRASLSRRCGGQQIEEALDGVQLPLRLRIEFRREDGRGGVRGQQREELVVDRGERVLLLQQPVDGDQPDDVLLDLERHRGQRLLQRHLPAVDVLVDVVALAGLGHLAQDSFAQARGDRFHAGHDVLALAGDGLQLVRLLVEQKDGERLRADQVDDDLLHDLDDFAEVERGVELIAGHVE